MAAFALTWYVSGAGGLSSGRFYQVVFRGSVNGLTNGAVVTFNGLRVGEVVSVGYVANDPGAVSSLIKVEGDVPVRADTVAKLESQGLGGASTIALIGGAPDAPDLKSENGNPPKLIGESSSMANLLENVASLSSKAESAVTKADALIGDNSAALGDAVKNLDRILQGAGRQRPGAETDAGRARRTRQARRPARRPCRQAGGRRRPRHRRRRPRPRPFDRQQRRRTDEKAQRFRRQARGHRGVAQRIGLQGSARRIRRHRQVDAPARRRP